MNAVHLYRVGNWLYRHRIPLLPKLTYWLTFLIYNSSIPPQASIGAGTRFGYGGMGVVIHMRARIGRRVMIAQQVTIGGRSGHFEVPIVGDDVLIGAGAKVLGPIRVGHRAEIGANAVVTHDVPDDAIVAGIPARTLRIKQSGMDARALAHPNHSGLGATSVGDE